MSKIIFPKAVIPSSKIGLTAMSSGIEDKRDENKINNGIKNIISKGFQIVETPDVRTSKKFVSASRKTKSKRIYGVMAKGRYSIHCYCIWWRVFDGNFTIYR